MTVQERYLVDVDLSTVPLFKTRCLVIGSGIAGLSAALAAVLLSAPLSFSFWQGAMLVCAGSLLCWYATRTRKG